MSFEIFNTLIRRRDSSLVASQSRCVASVVAMRVNFGRAVGVFGDDNNRAGIAEVDAENACRVSHSTTADLACLRRNRRHCLAACCNCLVVASNRAGGGCGKSTGSLIVRIFQVPIHGAFHTAVGHVKSNLRLLFG